MSIFDFSHELCPKISRSAHPLNNISVLSGTIYDCFAKPVDNNKQSRCSLSTLGFCDELWSSTSNEPMDRYGFSLSRNMNFFSSKNSQRQKTVLLIVDYSRFLWRTATQNLKINSWTREVGGRRIDLYHGSSDLGGGGFSGLLCLREPKVCHLGHHLLIQQHIAGLDIHMHDLGVSKFVQIGQAPRSSQSDLQPAIPIQRIVGSYTCTNQASET